MEAFIIMQFEMNSYFSFYSDENIKILDDSHLWAFLKDYKYSAFKACGVDG